MYNMRILYFLVVFLFGFCFSSSAENNGTFGETINGEGLVKLGRELNKPMLTLIGMAIQNVHLNQSPCEEWSPWAPCDATGRGYFGSQTRSRSCSGHVTESNEIETKLCEGGDKNIDDDRGFCPDNYNITNNGFCLKLHRTRASNDEAVKQCQLEGGYLVHIDSQQKLDDVRSILDDDGFSGIISIDGRRKDASSPWEFKYGSQHVFLQWESGYPYSYPCLYMDITRGQIDSLCAAKTSAFICEILKD